MTREAPREKRADPVLGSVDVGVTTKCNAEVNAVTCLLSGELTTSE